MYNIFKNLDLGFFHEQERPDRLEHIEILKENFANPQTDIPIRSNVATFGAPYDPCSIMHPVLNIYGKVRNVIRHLSFLKMHFFRKKTSGLLTRRLSLGVGKFFS